MHSADASDDIPLFRIPWGRREVRYALDAITRGSHWAKGPYVGQFESALERTLGVDHAVTVNSGTTALEVALEALGVGPGDEVVVPSFTFVAVANAVTRVGADPVFADIERETLGLDPSDVAATVTDTTAAIVAVHIYGQPCRIEELRAVADDQGVALVEDCAEAHSATVAGRQVGTFGDVATFSFCQNKLVTTGEGGAVVTDDDRLADTVRAIRNHGTSPETGQFERPGSNYRLSDLHAALGCAQLEALDERRRRRRELADWFDQRFQQVDGIAPAPTRADRKHVYQLYTVLLEQPATRATVRERLREANIGSKPYWDPPIHRTPAYAAHADRELPVTDDVAERALSLPMCPDLRRAECERILDVVTAAAETA